MRCESKTRYGCEQLAANAAWLHEAAYPGCEGVEPYRCPRCGEWHIGHVTRAGGTACKLVGRPPLHRPRHRPGRRAAT